MTIVPGLVCFPLTITLFLLSSLYLLDEVTAIAFDLLIVMRDFLNYYLIIARKIWLLIHGLDVIDILIQFWFVSINHFS